MKCIHLILLKFNFILCIKFSSIAVFVYETYFTHGLLQYFASLVVRLELLKVYTLISMQMLFILAIFQLTKVLHCKHSTVA